jgi:hypothetical protein
MEGSNERNTAKAMPILQYKILGGMMEKIQLKTLDQAISLIKDKIKRLEEDHNPIRPSCDYSKDLHAADYFLAMLENLKANMEETASKDRKLLVELSDPDDTDVAAVAELNPAYNQHMFELIHSARLTMKIRKHLQENPL